MRKLLTIIAATAICAAATAQKAATLDVAADEVVVRWNNATAPHSSEELRDEVVSKAGGVSRVTETVFYVFKADKEKATGRAVVIFPGGGYSRVNVGSCALAKWLKANGITAVVVKYRLPNGHPIVPLEDAQEALRYTRANAKKWHIDPAKVGICGSSAGGHLAAYTSTFTPDEEKPAFTILFYPVITGATWETHLNTFKYLLGADRSSLDQIEYSLENHVTKTTPPTLLLLSDDDKVVPPISSVLYYEALKMNGVKASMHIFPVGGHGWAGNESFQYKEQYRKYILDWLAKLN